MDLAHIVKLPLSLTLLLRLLTTLMMTQTTHSETKTFHAISPLPSNSKVSSILEDLARRHASGCMRIFHHIRIFAQLVSRNHHTSPQCKQRGLHQSRLPSLYLLHVCLNISSSLGIWRAC